MKLKYNFETVKMDDEIILVPVGEGSAEVHGVLKLNTEGYEILNLLEKTSNEAQIIDTLTSKYENDRDTIAGYVHDVLKKLRDAGLLDE